MNVCVCVWGGVPCLVRQNWRISKHWLGSHSPPPPPLPAPHSQGKGTPVVKFSWENIQQLVTLLCGMWRRGWRAVLCLKQTWHMKSARPCALKSGPKGPWSWLWGILSYSFGSGERQMKYHKLIQSKHLSPSEELMKSQRKGGGESRRGGREGGLH